MKFIFIVVILNGSEAGARDRTIAGHCDAADGIVCDACSLDIPACSNDAVCRL